MNCFLLPLAAKNILRNTRRSILSGITIFLAAIIICMLIALEKAEINDMKQNTIHHVTGNIRIRAQDFTDNERVMPLQFFIPHTNALKNAIEQIESVTGVIPQINIPVIMYRNNQTKDVHVLGTDFSFSGFFTDRNTQFLSGSVPKGERQAVLSEGLASKYNFSTGDKFTVMTKTATGGTNAVTLTVSGIIHVGDTDFNGTHFFMDWKELSKILRLAENSIELLVFTDPKADSATLNQKIIPEIKKNVQQIGITETLDIREWVETSVFFSMIQMHDAMYLIMSIFFFLLASTVIFNTTMMSVLERKKEIGTLMSLGMAQNTITGLFLLETALIAFVSSLIGVIVAYIIVSFLSVYGINLNALGGNSISGFNFSSWIYPSLEPITYVIVLCTGTIVSVVACIIPVSLIRKIQPAQALRTEN